MYHSSTFEFSSEDVEAIMRQKARVFVARQKRQMKQAQPRREKAATAGDVMKNCPRGLRHVSID